jgi:XTP/dITP diphosphohydrolase
MRLRPPGTGIQMREILLATGNPKKAREMQEILRTADPGGQIRWRLLSEFTGWPQAVEDKATFLDNARIKARHYARWSGLWTVADDSGLEVDALNGEPGVRSARYSGEPSNDAANNALLIQRLAGVPPERRSARFRCVVALSDGQKTLAWAEGTVEGRIVDTPRGSNGFGYDPHFWVEQAGMTTAQMPSEQKHAISHRGQALRRLREQLSRLLQNEPT